MRLSDFIWAIFTGGIKAILRLLGFFVYSATQKKETNFIPDDFLKSLGSVEGTCTALEKNKYPLFDNAEVTEIWVTLENGTEKRFILFNMEFPLRPGHRIRVTYSTALEIKSNKNFLESENFALKIDNISTDLRCITLQPCDIYSLYTGYDVRAGSFYRIVLSIVAGFFSFMFLGSGIIGINGPMGNDPIGNLMAIVIFFPLSILLGVFSYRKFTNKAKKAKQNAELNSIEQQLTSF